MGLRDVAGAAEGTPGVSGNGSADPSRCTASHAEDGHLEPSCGFDYEAIDREVFHVASPTSFGEDWRGELYVVTYGGQVYKLSAF